MPVIEHDNCLKIVRLELEPSKIPALLEAHRKEWEAPGRLEDEARQLEAGGFDPTAAVEFADSVIQWGRGYRFAGRFRSGNAPHTVASALRLAASKVDAGSVPDAVSEVGKLRYLGQSFASKIVRFLRPHHAVILDEVLRTRLGYPESAAGYEAFLADCRAIQQAVADRFPDLRVCDVEAALFAKVKDYLNRCPTASA